MAGADLRRSCPEPADEELLALKCREKRSFSSKSVPRNDLLRRKLKKKFAAIAVPPRIDEIQASNMAGRLGMARTEFEPFGERIDLTENGQVRSRASKWLAWTGSALFWTLAGAIVVARAAYFEPAMLDGLGRVVAFFKAFPVG